MPYPRRRYGFWKKTTMAILVSGVPLIRHWSDIWQKKDCLWVGFGIAIIWIQIEMHMEFLIEDASGGRMPECLLPKILGEYGTTHTWRIHP